MSATKAAPVAIVFASSAIAMFPPARRSPMMPEPTSGDQHAGSSKFSGSATRQRGLHGDDDTSVVAGLRRPGVTCSLPLRRSSFEHLRSATCAGGGGINVLHAVQHRWRQIGDVLVPMSSQRHVLGGSGVFIPDGADAGPLQPAPRFEVPRPPLLRRLLVSCFRLGHRPGNKSTLQSAHQEEGGMPDLVERCRPFDPAMFALVEGGTHQRDSVEAEEGDLRCRVIGLGEAKIKKYGIEVMALFGGRELAG